MTSLSDYLRAERFDLSEPAGFYVPGVDSWGQLNRAEARAYLATRHQQTPDELDLDDDFMADLGN